MLQVLLKQSIKLSSFIILILLMCVSKSFALDKQFYSTENLEQIGILLIVAVLIFCPKNARIVVLGVLIGLALVYFSYKYVLPIIML